MDQKQHRALALCRRSPRDGHVELKRRTERDGHRAHFAQLVYCGKTVCPLCGAKIAAERAADIALGLSSHYAAGGRVLFATYTLPHTRAQGLSELLSGLSRGWAAIRQNKTPRRLLRAHTVGWIKRLEVTVGENGWHPHLHVFRFLKPGVSDAQAAELAAAEYDTWARSMQRRGLGIPSREHGLVWKVLELDQAHEEVARYAAKSAGLELASAGTKIGRTTGSRSPLQVLHDFGEHGELRDRELWFEYVEAMHGRHHLQWSDGLRVQLLAGVPELSDEEAAAADDRLGKLLGVLDRDTWRRIGEWEPGPAQVLEWAELVDDVDQAAELVDRELRRHGLGRLDCHVDSDSHCQPDRGEEVNDEDAKQPGDAAAAPAPAGPGPYAVGAEPRVCGLLDPAPAPGVGDRQHGAVTSEPEARRAPPGAGAAPQAAPPASRLSAYRRREAAVQPGGSAGEQPPRSRGPSGSAPPPR